MFPLKDNIPLQRVPLVTILLLAINVVVYLLEIRHGGSFFSGPTEQVAVRWGAIPYELTHPGESLRPDHPSRHRGVRRAKWPARANRAFTERRPRSPPPGSRPSPRCSCTRSFLHIFGNMLFLAIFGPTLEDRIGRLKFLAFYLLGGLVALGAQIAINPDSTAPTLGASGAIAAVLGGYILLWPRARILSLVFIIFFVTIIEVPALVLLGIWFANAAVLRPRRACPGRSAAKVSPTSPTSAASSSDCW